MIPSDSWLYEIKQDILLAFNLWNRILSAIVLQVNQVKKIRFLPKKTQCTLVEERSLDFLLRIFFCCNHLPGHLESHLMTVVYKIRAFSIHWKNYKMSRYLQNHNSHVALPNCAGSWGIIILNLGEFCMFLMKKKSSAFLCYWWSVSVPMSSLWVLKLAVWSVKVRDFSLVYLIRWR